MRVQPEVAATIGLLFILTVVFAFDGKVSEYCKAAHDDGREYYQDDETKDQVFLFAR